MADTLLTSLSRLRNAGVLVSWPLNDWPDMPDFDIDGFYTGNDD